MWKHYFERLDSALSTVIISVWGWATAEVALLLQVERRSGGGRSREMTEDIAG